MLIRSIRAENFMKFRRLDLTDFPERGLVGIIGKNEGGKTTIGELIQFALFGKTLSVSRGSILDLIHWDRDQCVVELEFEHEGIFRVWREIDRYGTNYARLLRVDADDPTRTEEVASGSMPVAKELETRLRFGFDDFLRSFYLAERDFPRSPEKMRDYLDRMTGVEVLLSARESAGERIGEFEERFGEIQAQIRRNEQQIARYLPHVEKIPELEEALSGHDESVGALKEEQRRLQAQLQDLEERVSGRAGLGERLASLGKVPTESLRQKIGGLRRECAAQPAPPEGEKGRASILDGLDRLDRLGEEAEELGGVVESAERALAGRLDGDGSDSFGAREREESARLMRSRSGRRARNNAALFIFILGAGFAFVGLSDTYFLLGEENRITPTSFGDHRGTGFAVVALGALSWLVASALAGAASRSRGEMLDADGALSRLAMDREGAEGTRGALAQFRQNSGKSPIAIVADFLDGVRHEAVAERLDRFKKKVSDTIRTEDGDLFRDLAAADQRILAAARSEAKALRKQVQEASELLKKQQSKRDRVQSEIREYQKQDGRRTELEEKSVQLRKEVADLREEMDVHHLAQELLGETADSIRHRAGPSLGKGIRRLLPFLTDGRYQDLQVTPDFHLRLFTGAKSDFLDTHELSGGTLEGLSFGFRLTFAQAFVGAVTRAPQFLFLDEPFRAMDRHRVAKTLEALHRLSDELPQVLVVLPVLEPSERSAFDCVIETRVDGQELVQSIRKSTQSRGRSENSPAEARTETTGVRTPGEAVTAKSGVGEIRSGGRSRRRKELRDRPGSSEERPTTELDPARARTEGPPAAVEARVVSPPVPSPRAERPSAEQPSAERPSAERPSAERPSAAPPSAAPPSAAPPSAAPPSAAPPPAEARERAPEQRSSSLPGPDRAAAEAPKVADPAPARAIAPPAASPPLPPSSSPRRAREDAGDDPSQFLAGIFDVPPSREKRSEEERTSDRSG